MSDSELYSRLLLLKGHGYPLWHPEPSDDLPELAKRTGTEIGDVGVVTEDGSFDRIFNILCAPNDRTNRFGVPPGFVQLALPPGDICTKIQRYPPGYVISNTTVKKVGGMEDSELLSIGARAVFEVSTNVNEMGLLVLPDGASSWDARSQHIFRDYALKHGRGWYAWVNGDLGRMIRNSGLYLVTGVTKSTSWCIAAENNSWDDQKVSLMLKPVPVGVTAASCAWEWENASVCAHSGPHRLPGEESWRDNQTVFIRGFKVSLRSQKDLSPLSGDNSEDEEWVDEYVPNLFHPSDIINQYLLESVPNAMVAVTHDDEWVSVLNEADNKAPEDDELMRRILNKFAIGIFSGGVCLRSDEYQFAASEGRKTIDHPSDTGDMDNSTLPARSILTPFNPK